VNQAAADGSMPLFVAVTPTNQSLQCFARILASNRTTPASLTNTTIRLRKLYRNPTWGPIGKRAVAAIKAHTADEPAWCNHCFTVPTKPTPLLTCSEFQQVGYCDKVCQAADLNAGRTTAASESAAPAPTVADDRAAAAEKRRKKKEKAARQKAKKEAEAVDGVC
jgi:hypothetical protein